MQVIDPHPSKIDLDAEKRVQKIKKFYTQLASWVGTSIFLVALDLFLSGGISWSKYPVFFWGISILVQFFKVLPLLKMDRAWEEKMKRKFKETHEEHALPEGEAPIDYTGELLNKEPLPESEYQDLKEYRKVARPWKDEDLV